MKLLESHMANPESPLRQSRAVASETWPRRAPSNLPSRRATNLSGSTNLGRIKSASAWAISFGAFRLLPAQQLLLHEDVPVPLGSRAMDILIALVERAGELVSKEELMTRVWPNTFVSPANLAVQLCALRRALGDGRDGNRFVINIPGRGYRFVAPVILAAACRERLRRQRCAQNSASSESL
jgi:DNA-binding winged helix-turn-helix (wHTH) protein